MKLIMEFPKESIWCMVAIYALSSTSFSADIRTDAEIYLSRQAEEVRKKTAQTPNALASLHELLAMTAEAKRRSPLTPAPRSEEKRFIELSRDIAGYRAQLDVAESRAASTFDRASPTVKARAKEVWITDERRYRAPVKATFKLINLGIGPTTEWANINDRVTNIVSGMKANIPFDDLAKQYGDDMKQESNVYSVDESQVEPHIWKLLLKDLAVGASSGPVVIAGGVMFAQLVSKQLGEKLSFESVEQEIIDTMQHDHAVKAREAVLNTLRAQVNPAAAITKK